VIKAFELNGETVAFLCQVFEYRCEIRHAEILAGMAVWNDNLSLRTFTAQIWPAASGDGHRTPDGKRASSYRTSP
jgi:hypothetical protein